MPDQNHFIEEDTKIVSTLVDSGGDCEKQTLNVSKSQIILTQFY